MVIQLGYVSDIEIIVEITQVRVTHVCVRTSSPTLEQNSSSVN